ncbi:MAG: AsmA family protein [Rhodocyclales bacterium]|nr:AsmA family protein [Rhodocyclales bacterium]
MKKALRSAGLLVAGTVVLAVVLALLGVALVTSRFGADMIKTQLAQAMLEQKQRVLRIDGIAIALWPHIDLRLTGVALSEPGGAAEFAAVDAVHVALDPKPLQSRQWVVAAVEVQGLRATLIRRRDGRLNIDDLLPAPDPASPPPQAALAALTLADLRLTWRDEKAGSTTPLPQIDLAAAGLALGDQGWRVEHLSAAFAAPPRQLKAGLVVFGLAGTGRSLVVDKFAGSVDLADPALVRSPVHLPYEGRVQADLEKRSAAGRLAARLDESTLTLDFKLSRFAPPALEFDLAIDRLDLDRYLPEQRAGAAEDGKADLGWLHDLEVKGRARIGSLRVANVQASQLQFEIKAERGRLAVSSLPAVGKRK